MKDHQKSIGGAQEHEGSVDAVFSVKATDEVGGAISFSFFSERCNIQFTG